MIQNESFHYIFFLYGLSNRIHHKNNTLMINFWHGNGGLNNLQKTHSFSVHHHVFVTNCLQSQRLGMLPENPFAKL